MSLNIGRVNITLKRVKRCKCSKEETWKYYIKCKGFYGTKSKGIQELYKPCGYEILRSTYVGRKLKEEERQYEQLTVAESTLQNERYQLRFS